MKIVSLNVRDFKRLKSSHFWNFPDGIIGITGPNGKGKSTIGAAIAWALYGPEMLPTGKADVVTWGADHAIVQLTIEINGKQYMITRKQEKNGVSDAEMALVSADPAWPPQFLSRGVDPTNREVQKLLGMDRVGFLTSVYARQKELDGLMSQTPANRVKTMLRLLGIEQLTAAIEQVRAEARDGRKQSEFLRAEAENPQSVKELMAFMENTIKETEEKMAVEKEMLSKIEKEKEGLALDLSRLIPKQQALQQYSERAGKSEMAFRSAEAELRSAERAYEALTPAKAPGPEPDAVDDKTVHEAEIALVTVRQKRIDIRNKIEGITKNSKCYACDRPFDHSADSGTQIEELKREDDVLAGEDENLYAELTILKNDRTRHLRWKADRMLWDRWQDEQEVALERVESARFALAAAHEYMERVRREAPDFGDLENINDLQEKRLEAEIAAGRIRETLSTLAEIAQNRRYNFEVAADRYKRAKELNDRINDIVRNALSHDVAASELSALKEKMIGAVIPTLTEKASSLVSKFTDGRYTEVYLTPDYEIQYRNDLGELKSFQNLSGGEKNVFALALRLAISDLRSDSIGVLLLDEVLDAMDPDRQESTWTTLERLTNRYQQVFLITHVQSFKDRAPTVISL